MAARKRKTDPKTTDVLIAGAGYVGLSCAVAIKSAAPHMAVTTVDPAPLAAIENDERSSAIAPDATQMLSALGIWDKLIGEAQPITEMIVTDSKVSDITRPVFLTFSGEEQSGQPLAHMVENRNMVKALRAKAKTLGVEIIAEDAIEPDSIAFHDDIAHAQEALLAGEVSYAAQFIESLALCVGDHALTGRAQKLARAPESKDEQGKMAAMLEHRLGTREAV